MTVYRFVELLKTFQNINNGVLVRFGSFMATCSVRFYSSVLFPSLIQTEAEMLSGYQSHVGIRRQAFSD